VNITSFGQFQKYITEEQKNKDLNVVRFINTENLTLWLKVKNFLLIKSQRQMLLSDFCLDEDLIPVLSRLYASLQSIDSTTLLLPLSEHLRIDNSKVVEVLYKIAKTEFKTDVLSNNIRLYIPMYRMKQSLIRLIEFDRRLVNHVIFLEDEDKDLDYSLTIISRELDVTIHGNNIQGYKKYLEYWEDNPSKPIILHTKNAVYYKNNVFADNVKVLVSAYDIMTFHNMVKNRIEENWGTEWQWRELLSRMKNFTELNSVFENTFGLTKFNFKVLLTQWKDSTDFEKWLIWLWAKLEAKMGLIYEIVNNSTSYLELPQAITMYIFNIDPKSKDYKDSYLEWLEYRDALGIDVLPPGFWTKYETQKDSEKLYRICDRTEKEKAEIINIIKNLGFTAKVRDFLQYAYPDLHLYLSNYAFEETTFAEYFASYKLNKVQNSFSDEFVSKVNQLAEKKGVWLKLKSRNSLIDEMYENNTLIIWVDALGVEYISLIEGILLKKYTSIFSSISISYSQIPTVTELNKDFLIGRDFKDIRELDELKHKGEYPDYIMKELGIIETVMKTAVQKLDTYDRVIITSDHGSSRGALISNGNTFKPEENAKVLRHGRYCEDEKNSYDSKFSACIDKGKYHVFANYDRFSIGGNVKGEIHGGATLEEVLVPVILLSKTPIDEEALITLLTPEIKLRAGENIVVKFRVDKQYGKIYATVDGKRYSCFKGEDYWFFEPEIDKKVIYNVKLSAKGSIGEFEFKVLKGRTDNKNFDI